MSTGGSYRGMSESARLNMRRGATTQSLLLSIRSFLERSQVTQTTINVFLVVGAFLLASVTGVGFAASLVYFLFLET